MMIILIIKYVIIKYVIIILMLLVELLVGWYVGNIYITIIIN